MEYQHQFDLAKVWQKKGYTFSLTAASFATQTAKGEQGLYLSTESTDKKSTGYSGQGRVTGTFGITETEPNTTCQHRNWNYLYFEVYHLITKRTILDLTFSILRRPPSIFQPNLPLDPIDHLGTQPDSHISVLFRISPCKSTFKIWSKCVHSNCDCPAFRSSHVLVSRSMILPESNALLLGF